MVETNDITTVEFQEIQASQLRTWVHAAFEGDEALIHRYHLVNGDLNVCVESTLDEIETVQNSDDGVSLRYYGIMHKHQVIGFTVVGKLFLLSFGLNIHARTKPIVMSWWQQVVRKLNGNFFTWIFKKNNPAILFLQRQGMEIVEDYGHYVALAYYMDQATFEKELRQITA